MMRSVCLKGSVLVSVLVVCTLMLLGLLVVYLFFDMSNAGLYMWHKREQQRANLESGFTLYCQDSVFNGVYPANDSVRLFPGDPTSVVYLSAGCWGGYKLVKVESQDRRQHIVRMVGRRAVFHDKDAVLYVPDRGRALGIAGSTGVVGNAYVPANGVFYPQIRSVFFEGVQLEKRRLRLSDPSLPPIRLPGDFVKACVPGPVVTDLGYFRHPFGEDMRVIPCGPELRQVNVAGHVVLYSENPLYIDSTSLLQNVIVMAPVVRLGNGFRGRLQIWAMDSVILGSRVWLEYPSGVYVYGNKADRLAWVGEHSRVEGYVAVGDGEGREGCPVLRLPATAFCRGLVYAGGVAHIAGRVRGCLFVREPSLFATEGYYSMVLYGVDIGPDDETAYPFLLDGPYERRCAAWLE